MVRNAEHVPVETRPGVYVCARCGAGARWDGRRHTGTMTQQNTKCFDDEKEAR